jgi:polar amino acid transport system substrate-binding protein
MTLKLSLLAAPIVALVVGAAPVAADGLPDLAGRTIKAVTENAYYPLNFADPKNGDGIGMEYDLINEIAKRLNAKVEWGVSAWDVMIEAVKSGQYDVGADGITISDERKQQVDFTDPYIQVDQFFLVRANEDRISGPDSFKTNPDLLIGAQAGTSGFYTAVYNVLGGDEATPRIKLFDTFGASMQALKAGDVDAVIADQAASAGYMGAEPGAFKNVGASLQSDPLGLILTPGSDLVGPFNAALAEMKADGTLDKLTTHWFFEYGQSH